MDIQFYTLEALRTPVGITAAVWMLTQFVKGLIDRFMPNSTRYVALVIAWALLLALAAIDGKFSGSAMLLSLLNGAVVATAASGGHDLVANAGKRNGGEDNDWQRNEGPRNDGQRHDARRRER